MMIALALRTLLFGDGDVASAVRIDRFTRFWD